MSFLLFFIFILKIFFFFSLNMGMYQNVNSEKNNKKICLRCSKSLCNISLQECVKIRDVGR